VVVEINRALFRALTASMGAVAALSTNGCSSDDASSNDQTDATGVDAVSSDVAVDGLEDSTTQVPADGTADTSVVPGIDATPDVAADHAVMDSAAAADVALDAADAEAEATIDAADAGSLPALPDGGVNEACPAFTCELGELNCRAAYSGGVIDSAALALYACAQTVCNSDSGAGSFAAGTGCAAGALEATPAQPNVTSFCAPQASCSDAGNHLGVGACEQYFSSLTPGALGAFQMSRLHDAGLTCTDTGSLTFTVLSALAYP
jgi:hypothetical protein